MNGGERRGLMILKTPKLNMPFLKLLTCQFNVWALVQGISGAKLLIHGPCHNLCSSKTREWKNIFVLLPGLVLGDFSSLSTLNLPIPFTKLHHME